MFADTMDPNCQHNFSLYKINFLFSYQNICKKQQNRDVACKFGEKGEKRHLTKITLKIVAIKRHQNLPYNLFYMILSSDDIR